MKPVRNTKPAHYHSDSELKKRQIANQPHSNSNAKKTRSFENSDDWDFIPAPKELKKPLFPSNVSLKTLANQLLSEEVYDDFISFLIIVMSLPLLLVKRLFSTLMLIYRKIDGLFFDSLKRVNQALEEKKKSKFEQRRFSKNTKLELFFKKKQLEEKSKICQNSKLDLVLDLDETLIHCSARKLDYKAYEFEIMKDNAQKEKAPKEKFYFSKRPFLEDFLEEVSMFFNVHVYTAGEKSYADMILSVIDPKNKIQKRLYRNDCIQEGEHYIKDLRKINPDLTKVIMVDNSEEAVRNHLENSFIIKSWYGHDKCDSELEYFAKMLMELAYTQEDVRTKVRRIKRELRLKYMS